MLRYLTAFFLLLPLSLVSQSLVINEFMASNTFVIADNYGQLDDWVEIYNPGAEPVDMAGMYITDNLNNPNKWQIEGGSPFFTTVPAGGYLIIWCDGDSSLQGANHTNFKLQRAGEQIGIYSSDLMVIDTLTYTEQEKDNSYGRYLDGEEDWFFFAEPSPEYSNNGSTPYFGFVKGEPLFSLERGFYTGAQTLSLSQTFTSGEIHYTLDGSKPSWDSPLYSGEIPINGNVTVRAAVFQEDLVPSDIKTKSYFIDYLLAERKLPVISLASESEIFWDSETGLLVQDALFETEYETNLEFFEDDGDGKESQRVGIFISENESAQVPQTPLSFIGRDEYGEKNFNHRLFNELNLNAFRTFDLSNSNLDWGKTLVKNLLAQNITKDNLQVEHHFSRPVSVHANMDYLGMYELQVPLDAKYIGDLYLLDNDSIDIIWGNGAALSGTAQQYFEWLNYLESNNFSSNETFQELEQSSSIDSYIDYLISLLYFGAPNWAENNAWQWKSQQGGEWKWIVKGFDESYSDVNDYLLEYLSTEDELINPSWLTLPFRRMLENELFRERFISSLADHCYITFNPNLLDAELSNIQFLLENEMSYHIQLWADSGNTYVNSIPSFNGWQSELDSLGQYCNQRIDAIHTNSLGFFDEVSSMAELNLQVVGNGGIMLNELTVPDSSWEGHYFQDLEFSLTAIPDEGYQFVEWLGADVSDVNASIISLILDENATITALFEPAPDYSISMIINELKYESDTLINAGDWIELYNNSENIVDISKWTVHDSQDFFQFPANEILLPNEYLVVSSDVSSFERHYGENEGAIGNLGFGLSSNEEEIILKNSNGLTMDSVFYQNAEPWPVLESNTARTIELVAPYLDNIYGHNWISSLDTNGTALELNSANSLHLGKVSNQEINIGDSFEAIDFNELIFSPNADVSDLTWSFEGNENITIDFNDETLIANLDYGLWQGTEWIHFSVSDDFDGLSSDSALFTVGTIINVNTICDETFVEQLSPYIVTSSFIVPQGCSLDVEAGVELRFMKNTEIICKGTLSMAGDESNRIELKNHTSNWNGILLDSTLTPASFEYVLFQGATFGTDSAKQNAALTGYFSDFEVSNCEFDNNLRSIYAWYGAVHLSETIFNESNYGEKVNLQFSDAITEDCVFHYTYGDNDALDYDAVDNGKILNNVLWGGEDDGIDIGQINGVSCNDVLIQGNRVFNYFDKDISVGEGSQNINIDHNLLVGAYYGVGVKDSSTAIIDHCTIDLNKYGVACFQKNIGLGGGIAHVSNTIISNSTTSSLLIGDASQLYTDYCSSDLEVLNGEDNILANPEYVNPSSYDYNLGLYSPCIDAGDPNYELDLDDTRSDLGAYFVDQNLLENPVSLEIVLYPNPVIQQFSLTIMNATEEEAILRIYDENSRLVFDEHASSPSLDIFGNIRFELNVKYLSAGNYIFEFTQGDRVVVKEFVCVAG